MKNFALKSIIALTLLIGANGMMMGQDGTLTVTRTSTTALKAAIEYELIATSQNVKDITTIVIVSSGSTISEGDYTNLRSFSETITEEGVEVTYNLKDYLTTIDLTNATGAYGFLPAKAFQSMINIEKIILNPSTVGIYSYAFDGCTSLKEVTNLANITRVASYAFRNCANLELNALPPKIATINEYAFSGCAKVTFSEWPQTITTIEGYAFSGTKVSFTTWPLNGATIGGNAFYNCPYITEFTIPEHITTIGVGAFYLAAANVNTFRNIYLPNHDIAPTLSLAANTWTYGAFANNNNARVHVKASAKGTYVDTANGSMSPSNWSHLTFMTYATGSTTLSGSWTAQELSDMNISDANLTDINMTNITVPAGVTLTGATNPNLLVYVGESDDTTVDVGNIIKGGSIASLTLTDKQPFNASSPFNVTDEVIYTRNTNAPAPGNDYALETICLPFAATVPPGYIVKPLLNTTESEVTLGNNVSTMTANTPYVLWSANAANDVEFKATGATINNTMNDTSSDIYTYKGAYQPITVTAEEGENYMYISDGKEFRLAGNSATILPFRAYLEGDIRNSSQPAPRQIIGIDEESGATNLDEDSNTNETYIYSVNGTLYVNSPKAQTLNIYAIDGRVIRTEAISEGENKIEGLSKGIYIIENKKVIVK